MSCYHSSILHLPFSPSCCCKFINVPPSLTHSHTHSHCTPPLVAAALSNNSSIIKLFSVTVLLVMSHAPDTCNNFNHCVLMHRLIFSRRLVTLWYPRNLIIKTNKRCHIRLHEPPQTTLTPLQSISVAKPLRLPHTQVVLRSFP